MVIVTQASKRQYMVAFTEGQSINSFFSNAKSLSLDQIERIANADDAEFGHAILEVIDTVLDLSIGQSIYFQPNRDDTNSKGIILRIR